MKNRGFRPLFFHAGCHSYDAPMQTFAPTRYNAMPFRRCGKSGLVLPAVSLGFWQNLGAPGNEDLCRQCCHFAFDHGITHFDLANNYGTPPGRSETVVGQIVKGMPRDELVISTKAGHPMWPGPYGDGGGKKYLVASLDQSLRRLGIEYVDIFYHHRPDNDVALEETMGALDLVVKQGKALYAGISKYPGTLTRQAVETMRQGGGQRLAIHQPRINLLERGAIDDVLSVADELGLGVIAFSPLAQGRLSGQYTAGLPADSRFGRSPEGQAWHAQQKAAGTWDKVAKLEAFARARHTTLAQLAMVWLLTDRRITSVLVGVSRLEQLKEAVAAAGKPVLTAQEMAEISALLA